MARQLFYDGLLADYAWFPRTIDNKEIIFDQDAGTIRGSAFTVAGNRAKVEAFAQDRDLEIGLVSLRQVVIRKRLTPAPIPRRPQMVPVPGRL